MRLNGVKLNYLNTMTTRFYFCCKSKWIVRFCNMGTPFAYIFITNKCKVMIWCSHSGSYDAILWHIAPCSTYMSRRFGGTYHLRLQGWILPSNLLSLVSCLADFQPWILKWYVPPKRRLIYGLHGTVLQKMENFKCKILVLEVGTLIPTVRNRHFGFSEMLFFVG
jgi:hypothetical protein